MKRLLQMRFVLLTVLVTIAGVLLVLAQTSSTPSPATKRKSADDKNASPAKTRATTVNKTAKPMSKTNPKTLQITITACKSDTGNLPVHAPMKKDGGLVVFSGDADYTITFQSPDFWQGAQDNVPISKDRGAALYADADSGRYTHFCIQGASCTAQCPPAQWPPQFKKSKGPLGSDPNDIIVP